MKLKEFLTGQKRVKLRDRGEVHEHSSREVKIHAEKVKVKRVPYTLQQVGDLLYKHKGHVKSVAEEMNVNVTALRRKINATPFLYAIHKEIDEQIVDDAKQQIISQVEQGSVAATTFVLRTLGKERGFTEKSLTEHDLGPNARSSSASLIEAMREGARKSEQKALEDKTIDVEATVE